MKAKWKGTAVITRTQLCYKFMPLIYFKVTYRLAPYPDGYTLAACKHIG